MADNVHLTIDGKTVEVAEGSMVMHAADKAGTVPNVPDRPEIGYRAQNALIAASPRAGASPTTTGCWRARPGGCRC